MISLGAAPAVQVQRPRNVAASVLSPNLKQETGEVMGSLSALYRNGSPATPASPRSRSGFMSEMSDSGRPARNGA